MELTYEHKYRVYESEMTAGEAVKMVEYFDEHHYWIEMIQEWFPSVTSKLHSVLSKGIGFEQWLRDTGNESKRIAKDASVSGSKIHDAINKIILGQSVNMEEYEKFDKKEWKKLSNWIDWVSHYNIKFLATEITVWSEKYKVAGTLDAICIIDGEVWVLDWKTGNNIYDDAYYQVACYFDMYNEMIDKGIFPDMPKATRAGIVHLGSTNRTFPKKGLTAPGIGVKEVDIVESIRVYERVNDIWGVKNKSYKPPQLEYNYELKIDKSLSIIGNPQEKFIEMEIEKVDLKKVSVKKADIPGMI